jgi:hypothetical protein
MNWQLLTTSPLLDELDHEAEELLAEEAEPHILELLTLTDLDLLDARLEAELEALRG